MKQENKTMKKLKGIKANTFLKAILNEIDIYTKECNHGGITTCDIDDVYIFLKKASKKVNNERN